MAEANTKKKAPAEGKGVVSKRKKQRKTKEPIVEDSKNTFSDV